MIDKTYIEQIKNTVNCITLAPMLGLSTIKKTGDRCSSFIHGGSNPNSVVVNTDYWYSFSDGQGGDVIDLYAIIKNDGDRGQAIHELASFCGIKLPNDDKYNQWIEYTQNLNNQIQAWHEQLNSDHLQYFTKRKITIDTINKLKIGYNQKTNRIIVPLWKNGYICYYIGRTLSEVTHENPKYLKPFLDGYNENILFGLDTLTRSNENLIIAEGCFDFLSFYQENYSVLSMCGGTFSKTQTKQILTYAKQFKCVYLTFDNDVSGKKFNISLAKQLLSHNIKFKFVHIPIKYKDISEYYTDGGNLQSLIDTAKNGIAELCNSMDDDSELENLLLSVTKYMSKTSVIRLFNQIQHNDPEFIKTLKSECCKPPSDTLIAQDILNRYTLIYNPKTSFYEYNGKYWIEREQTEVEQYIIKLIKNFATGSKIASIIKIIKALCVTNEIMNTKNVINFLNGTLDLTNLPRTIHSVSEIPFREHQKTDYATYILPYPYNPSIPYDDFEEYINTVTDNDPYKSAVLQETMGYILFPDNQELQTSTILVGGGSNGKSVYIDIIKNLFTPENISNVEMSSLASPFATIMLSKSLVNISAETSTKIEGAEHTFKQIVGGDTISACYKGKDYITFTPRAKMILSCNDLPRAHDTTYAWIRRFNIVSFDLTFIKNGVPRPEFNERRADTQLTKRLNKNLTGIFNYLVQGFIALHNMKHFTEIPSAEEIFEDYKELISPIVSFVKQFEWNDNSVYRNDEMYQIYKDWAMTNGYKIRNSQSFHTEFKKTIKDYRDDIFPYKNYKYRGYINHKKPDTFREN